MSRCLFFLVSFLCSFLLSGCGGYKALHDNKVAHPLDSSFPLKLDFKSYTVVNYIPTRKEYNLDYLLALEKWAQEKAMASGLQGDAVLALLEGRVSLKDDLENPDKKYLYVNILLSFDFKNHPTYGKGKVYFRLSEVDHLDESQVPDIQNYIHQKRVTLDSRFLKVIDSQFPLLKRAL